MKGPKDGVVKVKSQHDRIFTKKESKGIYLVSVGKKYHEGEFLEAALEFMRKHFRSCIIVVADTLQRHNYPMHNTDRLNYEAAKKEGDFWLERNKAQVFSDKNVSVSRWDEWIRHSMYSAERKKIDKLYDNDHGVRGAFRETAIEFLSKKNAGITEQDIKRSEEYLKEECSIIIPIWSAERVDRVVYPGALTPALKIIYERYSSAGVNGDYAKWLPISFKRYALLEKV